MTPLIMLPGMMCDARIFMPQIAAFSGRRTVICGAISHHCSIEQLALQLLEEAPRRFALAGLSMGGIVAMEMLRQAPERVERIALMDTNPLAEEEEKKATRVLQMKAIMDGDLIRVMRDEMKPNYLSDGPRRSEILDLCMEMALGLGPDEFLSQSRALMDRRDQTKTLRDANLPTLILCGREDTLCPLERHEMMADLVTGSHLEIIEGAGHLPTLEQPELTNAALARWLEE